MNQDSESQRRRELVLIAGGQLESFVHGANVVGDLRREDGAENVRRGDREIGAGSRDGAAKLSARHPGDYGAVSSRSRASGTPAAAGTEPLTQMR